MEYLKGVSAYIIGLSVIEARWTLVGSLQILPVSITSQDVTPARKTFVFAIYNEWHKRDNETNHFSMRSFGSLNDLRLALIYISICIYIYIYIHMHIYIYIALN